MDVLYIVLSIVYILFCVGLIAIILMQKKKSAGLGGSISGMGSSQTYWDKNKGRSLEGSLETYTKIGGLVLFVFTAVMSII